jgi:hypothetical protein
MDALRVLVGWAVEAALLAAGSGRLLQFVDGRAGMRTQRVRCARYNALESRRREISDCKTFSAGRSNG